MVESAGPEVGRGWLNPQKRLSGVATPPSYPETLIGSRAGVHFPDARGGTHTLINAVSSIEQYILLSAR